MGSIILLRYFINLTIIKEPYNNKNQENSFHKTIICELYRHIKNLEEKMLYFRGVISLLEETLTIHKIPLPEDYKKVK